MTVDHSASDPLACTAWALDLMREAFALVLGIVPDADHVDDAAHAIRAWHIESAYRRLVRVNGALRALASTSHDPRIAEVAERFERERDAASVRVAGLLAARDPAGAVTHAIVDDATGPIPILDDDPLRSAR